MLKDRMQELFGELFANYDIEIQAIILRVLLLEQENISMKRPRVRDQIDEIISQMASKAPEDTDESTVQE